MKIERLPKLRVSIINKCQLKCSFCGGNDTHMENFQPDDMGELIEYEQLLKIIKIYIDSGGKYVQFTGGEPLLYPKIDVLVNDVFNMNGIPEINTNGIALTVNMAKKLKDSGLNVIKISIPSFKKERYKETTGIDGLNRVLENVRKAKEYLKIRINTVAMKSHMDEIELAIDTCQSLGIKQLLFLELLYYYDIKEDSKRFFKSEYVDIYNEMGSIIEKKLDAPIKKFDFYNEFENNLLFCKSKINGFEVFIKQAQTTLRTLSCNKCKHFCQEGIYELRLSTGGYLSFCNVVNDNGKDLSKASEAEINDLFRQYLEIFNDGFVTDFTEFKLRHSI